MRRMLRIATLGTIGSAILAGVLAAPSSAAPNWIVDGRFMASNEELREIPGSGSNLKYGPFRFNGETVEFKCNTTFSMTLIGGDAVLQGEDEARAYALNGCTGVQPAGCSINNPEVFEAAGKPYWKSDLEVRGNRIYDNVWNVQYRNIKVSGCGSPLVGRSFRTGPVADLLYLVSPGLAGRMAMKLAAEDELEEEGGEGLDSSEGEISGEEEVEDKGNTLEAGIQHGYALEGSEILSSVSGGLSTDNGFSLKSVLGTTKIDIKSGKGKGTFLLETDAKEHAEIELEENSLYETNAKGENTLLTACKVPAMTVKVKGELGELGGLLVDKLLPKEGKSFTTLEITGSECALKKSGTSILGSFDGYLPEGATEKEVHLLEFLPPKLGSQLLELNKAVVELLGTASLTLTGKKLWSAH